MTIVKLVVDNKGLYLVDGHTLSYDVSIHSGVGDVTDKNSADKPFSVRGKYQFTIRLRL